MPQVIFQPYSVAVEVEAGVSLLEAARMVGVQIESDCGGQGVCGRCRVELRRGQVKGPGARHELPEGQVLACQAIAGTADVEVFVPEESRLVSEEVSVRPEGPAPLELSPEEGVIKRVALRLAEPSLEDNTADRERLLRALTAWQERQYCIPADVCRDMPRRLRDADWKPQVTLAEDVLGARVLDVAAGPVAAPCMLAVDVGTTVLKAVLLTPEGNWRAACANSQGLYGPDVITRIIYCERESDGLRNVQRLAVGDVNRMLSALLERAGVAREDVWALVASGNTSMIHFLLGLCPNWIRLEPYAACTYQPPPVDAREVGVQINPAGRVFALPSVSSYVGADITAGVLATRLHEGEAPAMLIDLGTNGEIVVGCREFMACCSASAGPAFEGAGSASGTWARPGAIAEVRDEDGLRWETLAGEKPVGICGTGYIDLLAALLRRGVMDKTGAFREGSSEALRRGRHGALEFELVGADESATGRAIVLTQADVANLVRAKGAIYAAGSVLLENLGMAWQDLGRIMLAGGFGEKIDVRNAITIGLLPDVPEDRISFVGNTSLKGAVLAALRAENYWKLREIACGMTYLELSTHPDFMGQFVSACFLPHTDTEKFPSVGVTALN